MKAILVLDEMPNNCSECPCCNDNECGNQYKGYVGAYIKWNCGKPSWCPLRPLPEKSDYLPKDDHAYSKVEIMAYTYGIAVGRNEVIDEITGETE